MSTGTSTVQARAGQVRRAATRARILGAARELLDQGEAVAAITVARVVAEAGVSRATFYLHFTGRRDLITELAAETGATWGTAAAGALEHINADRDELFGAVRDGLETWRLHAGVLAGLVEFAYYDPEIGEVWRASVEEAAASAAAWIAGVRPDLPELQRETIGRLLAWAGERTCHQMLGRAGDPQGVDALAEAFTEVMWCLAHPPPAGAAPA